MKIAFVGKGGSGKTTISALTARTLAAQNKPVLVIDADINQHLARTVGMSEQDAAAIPALGLEINRIKDYLRGSNPRIIDSASMIKTTPPGNGSRLLSLSKPNPLFDYFARTINGMQLMAVGPFDEEDLGVRCYHSKTGSVELILNHVVDSKDEYLLVDMTAGADSFASGLFTRFDVTFLMVEPTFKSVSVYEQYKQYARQHSVTIKAVGNKVANADDLTFIQERIGTDLVAVFGISDFVRNTDRAKHMPLQFLEAPNVEAISRIIDCANSQEKNWQRFYEQAIEFHRKNAESWANTAAKQDLTKQIDPTFTFADLTM